MAELVQEQGRHLSTHATVASRAEGHVQQERSLGALVSCAVGDVVGVGGQLG